MEKPSTPTRNLSPNEWDSLIDDFNYGAPRRLRWTTIFTPLSLLLDLSLSSILNKSLPASLKLHILIFLQESPSLFLPLSSSLPNLIQTLKLLLQSPIDSASVTFPLKDQILVTATSIVSTITDDYLDPALFPAVEELVAILIAIVNRPNHGVDRQSRAVACECLRVLEERFPGLLSEIVGHFWGLCQSERSHACQSYLLLLLQIIYHIANKKLSVGSIINVSVPLVPFNVPNSIRNGDGGSDGGELSGSNLKELRRVMSFMMEWTQVLTPCGAAEFMAMVMPVAIALELQSSLLKVQFSGLLYTFNPLLQHLVLMMYLDVPGAIDGHEGEVMKRLLFVSMDRQHRLVFRLLSLHWLIGVFGKGLGTGVVSGISGYMYPNLFDPLALKSLKMDLLASCYFLSRERVDGEKDVGIFVKYFEDCLVSVSGFKWLPPQSSETAVAFRTIHKFLCGGLYHSSAADSLASKVFVESTIFCTIQSMLANLMSDHPKLVPVVVALVDRLLQCQIHCFLGENLLLTFDENLLPKLTIGYKLSSYFPIIDRICKSVTISPQRLLKLLKKFMGFLVNKHGPDSGLTSWSQGSRVLGICRTMLMHHHSSRLFIALSHLLAFTALYFPDLEVRDNARIYLRMLICIPGKKLRQILNYGVQLTSISSSPHSNSFYNIPSPRHFQDPKRSKTISSYIHLERLVSLIVKQSWSLSLPPFDFKAEKSDHTEDIKESDAQSSEKEDEGHGNNELAIEARRIERKLEPLRVMDSKITRILEILRQYFSCIPDVRHMRGLKINISCMLRFKSEPFKRIWGVDTPSSAESGVNTLPAMYATVLSFSSSAPYGTIPSYHVPFLFGEPATPSYQVDSSDKQTLDIVPVEVDQKERFRAPVMIELEPREPVPGLVDVKIESNAESGQIIDGQLESVSVGIEDMFLRAVVPPDVPDDLVPGYYSDLFDALWEACGTTSNTGREVFMLKEGKGAATIYGTRSVKLLEVSSTYVIHAIERHLAPFVVSVIGEPLASLVKDRGIITNITWKEFFADSPHESSDAVADYDERPLYLTYFNEAEDRDGPSNMGKMNMGCFHVLVFLPPRFHLLFQFEVSEVSTLVRIRTDHWPCLAYIDDYLEALFFS